MSAGVLKEASCSCIEAIFVASSLESSTCVVLVSRRWLKTILQLLIWLGWLIDCANDVPVGDCTIVVRINPIPIRPRGKEMSKKATPVDC